MRKFVKVRREEEVDIALLDFDLMCAILDKTHAVKFINGKKVTFLIDKGIKDVDFNAYQFATLKIRNTPMTKLERLKTLHDLTGFNIPTILAFTQIAKFCDTETQFSLLNGKISTAEALKSAINPEELPF